MGLEKGTSIKRHLRGYFAEIYTYEVIITLGNMHSHQAIRIVLIIQDMKRNSTEEMIEGWAKRVNMSPPFTKDGHREDKCEDDHFYKGSRNYLDKQRS